VKCGVGCEHSTGLFDRIAQEFSPSGMLSFWHLWFSSFPPFFRRGFRLKKRSNALPKWSPAPSRPRCQGRVVFAFTGAQRTPLTGEVGGLGAVFTQEGQTGEKPVTLETYRGKL